MTATPAENLGRLEEVNPRDIWPGEATHFTPWLLDHADQLAEALGIDLELQHAEHPVGGFSLDLIGQDLTNDTVLIVENQLETTDLGQILTYAAGTNASTIVWIARPEPANVVASDLGNCQGQLAYRRVDWYFPGQGQTLGDGGHFDICPN